MADRNDTRRRDENELPSVTGEEGDGTAANIDGDVLVQDDVVYGSGTERRGPISASRRPMSSRPC